MAFRQHFYHSGECDRCNKAVASIHLEITTKHAAERQSISVCPACWEFLNKKVRKYEHEELVARGQVQPIAEEV